MKSVITCDTESRIQTFGKDAEVVFGWKADEQPQKAGGATADF